jgi:hypothetical protein
LFQICLVGIVERAEMFAVNIEHSHYVAYIIIYRYHNLALRLRAAGYVTRKLLDIRDDLGGTLCPGGATDTTPLGNMVTGYGTLKGT